MRAFIFLICLLFSIVVPVSTADDGMTREQADAILKELKEIRQVLEKMQQQQPAPRRGRPALPATAKISTKGRPALGKADAPVTMIEFVDFQCPYCQRFFKNTYPQLKQKYVDTGKLRIVVKDLPLGFHQFARKAAQAAHCAGDQGQYWAMHDTLFANISRLTEKDLVQHAQTLKLDTEAFKKCMDSDKHKALIDKDIADAGNARISGTPSFVVGKTTADVIDGTQIRGAQPLAVFERQIEQLLKP